MGVYGMTETAGSVVSLQPEDHDPGGPRAGLLRSVGKAPALAGAAGRRPGHGTDAAVGGVGEIWVRSGQNTVGYWGQPALTAETVTEDGWLRTGDAAYLDAEATCSCTTDEGHGRLRRGERVPGRVENVL